jgi:hypothetical protein
MITVSSPSDARVLLLLDLHRRSASCGPELSADSGLRFLLVVEHAFEPMLKSLHLKHDERKAVRRTKSDPAGEE